MAPSPTAKPQVYLVPMLHRSLRGNVFHILIFPLVAFTLGHTCTKYKPTSSHNRANAPNRLWQQNYFEDRVGAGARTPLSSPSYKVVTGRFLIPLFVNSTYRSSSLNEGYYISLHDAITYELPKHGYKFFPPQKVSDLADQPPQKRTLPNNVDVFCPTLWRFMTRPRPCGVSTYSKRYRIR